MDLGLQGRVALVSGASAGLGRAIAALVTAFKAIALRVAADGVTLNTLLPGSFATARIFQVSTEEQVAQRARALPVDRLGEPDDFAAAAAFLCSARASYVTGETLAVDGGKTRSVFWEMRPPGPLR